MKFIKIIASGAHKAGPVIEKAVPIVIAGCEVLRIIIREYRRSVRWPVRS